MLVSDHKFLKDLILLVNSLDSFDPARLLAEPPLQLSECLKHLSVFLSQVPVGLTEQPVNVRIVRERKLEQLRVERTAWLP